MIKQLLLLSFLIFTVACSQVDTGHRGAKVTNGKVSDEILSEGLYMYVPIFQGLKQVSIKTQSQKINLTCYTDEKTPITFDVTVLYKIPESSVRRVMVEITGDVYTSIIEPKAKESMMGVVSTIKTDDVIKKRGEIKEITLKLLKEKVGTLADIEDFIINNDQLPPELEKAVQEKMVQEQVALKAEYVKDEAKTKNEIIQMNATAQASANRTLTSSLTKELILYEFVKKSDGKLPLVMGSGMSTILNLSDIKK